MKIRLSSLLIFVILLRMTAVNANPQPSGSAISILSAPVTISHPGTYRLATDVTGDITIAASNVELNLDNRRINASTNGVVVTGQSEVLIRNGIIEGGTNGINVTTCTNIEVSDIDFIDNGTGLNVLTVTAVRVDACNFRGFSGDALCIDDTNNGHFSNCTMSYNNDSSNVVRAVNSVNLVFDKVFMNNNTSSAALSVFLLETCTNCLVNKCQASENESTSGDVYGFRTDNCTKSIFESSIANDNVATVIAAGFRILNDNTSCILNSFAKRNSGTVSSLGFNVEDCIDCLVKENVAIDNVGAGFNSGFLLETTALFGLGFTIGTVSNYSSGHGGIAGADNYTTVVLGVLVAPVIPVATIDLTTGAITAASKWENLRTLF